MAVEIRRTRRRVLDSIDRISRMGAGGGNRVENVENVDEALRADTRVVRPCNRVENVENVDEEGLSIIGRRGIM